MSDKVSWFRAPYVSMYVDKSRPQIVLWVTKDNTGTWQWVALHNDKWSDPINSSDRQACEKLAEEWYCNLPEVITLHGCPLQFVPFLDPTENIMEIVYDALGNSPYSDLVEGVDRPRDGDKLLPLATGQALNLMDLPRNMLS